jgi:hypothetical protein
MKHCNCRNEKKYIVNYMEGHCHVPVKPLDEKFLLGLTA